MKLKEISWMERPREKMSLKGRESLSNSEILAILLKTGTKEKNALSLAEELLSIDSSGIYYLSQVSLEELKKIRGIGNAKAAQIIAAVELGKRISGSDAPYNGSIASCNDAANLFMEEMRYLKKEHFKAALLDSKGKVICIDNISVGDLSSSLVHPRETFTNAVKRSAHSILLVHNHPSGNPAPSKQDIAVTIRLKEAGELLGINIIDHIIIGDGKYISLKEEGYI